MRSYTAAQIAAARGEPGVRPYGRHFRQADAGEREREKRPGTEND